MEKIIRLTEDLGKRRSSCNGGREISLCCSMINVGKAEFSYPYGVPGCHADPLVDANFPFRLWELRLKHLTKELIGGHVDHFD